MQYVHEASLAEINFTKITVYKVLKKLKTNKANGPDNISNRILLNTAEVISESLAVLLNSLFQIGTFPIQWKRANVIPVYKRKNKQDKSNYRPISLLFTVGKVMECCLFNELYDFCKQHNLLTWRNSGFKPDDSTVSQIISIIHRIHCSLDDNQDVLMIFLNIAKAFDKVFHEAILYKLESFGVRGKLLTWFESYLSNRQQRVIVDGFTYEFKSTNAGVPQGSILGPILFFNLYQRSPRSSQKRYIYVCR